MSSDIVFMPLKSIEAYVCCGFDIWASKYNSVHHLYGGMINSIFRFDNLSKIQIGYHLHEIRVAYMIHHIHDIVFPPVSFSNNSYAQQNCDVMPSALYYWFHDCKFFIGISIPKYINVYKIIYKFIVLSKYYIQINDSYTC